MFSKDYSILNIGLPLIVEAVPSDRVVHLQWEPPSFGDIEIARLTSMLDDNVTRKANEEAIAKVHSVRPQLQGIIPAKEAIPALQQRLLLHAGPPISFSQMCGPMQGALIGASIFEKWAKNEDEALTLLNSGEIQVSPCHHYGAVGPMAGVLSPSMPVFVVSDGDRKAYASMNEGLGKVLRFGAYDDEVIQRLEWMRDVLGPTLNRSLDITGPLDTTALFGQALAMGDEGHNRNVAATSLFTRKLAPFLSTLDGGRETLEFLASNDHFALNLSMAAAKLCMDAARGTENSTLVVAMARNGVQFGLQTAGTGDTWFTAEVGPADGLFFPGYSIEDANPDLGDSAITETLGIGGFAMAASPAITKFVGGAPSDALKISVEMRRITISQHPAFQLPPLNFAGSPSGIDVLKVSETDILPVINTGIAHKKAGIGQIGAGIVRAPKEVFLSAIREIARLRNLT